MTKTQNEKMEEFKEKLDEVQTFLKITSMPQVEIMQLNNIDCILEEWAKYVCVSGNVILMRLMHLIGNKMPSNPCPTKDIIDFIALTLRIKYQVECISGPLDPEEMRLKVEKNNRELDEFFNRGNFNEK